MMKKILNDIEKDIKKYTEKQKQNFEKNKGFSNTITTEIGKEKNAFYQGILSTLEYYKNRIENELKKYE